MACGDASSPNLLCHNKKLVKLQVIVTQTARDGSPPGNILFHKRPNHIALESLFVINDVIRDPDLLGHPASVINVVKRAAASLHRLRHAFLSCEPSLVPELHGQANHVVPVGAQHGRDGGGIHTARHCYGNGFDSQLLTPCFQLRTLVILSEAKNLMQFASASRSAW